MSKIFFLKMHGQGNDFVIIDKRRQQVSLSPPLIQLLCDRYMGIGCDQLVLLDKCDRADCEMFIFNQDCLPAEMCGNAARCVAWLLSKELNKNNITIKTQERILETTIDDARVTVNMGKPSYNWQDIPLDLEMDTLNMPIVVQDLPCPAAVSMGNPHLVFFVKNLQNVDVAKLGRLFEHHQFFPKRINVSFAQKTSDHEITVKVWERSAGLTLSCGSAACAVFAIARKKDLIENRANISLPGGVLQLEEGKDNDILMTGPVTLVFSGEFYYG